MECITSQVNHIISDGRIKTPSNLCPARKGAPQVFTVQSNSTEVLCARPLSEAPQDFTVPGPRWGSSGLYCEG